MTKTNKISVGIFIGLILIIGVLLGNSYLSKVFGANPVANNSRFPVDLIGSQMGTTTTSVGFYNFAASSTYPFRINGSDEVTLTLLAPKASSSGATARFSILASNDFQCDTASTSAGILNTTVVKDIKWYDAGKNLMNLDGSTSLSTGTTTITWAPSSGTGKQITLTNVNAQCLALQVRASSTKLMVQFKTKIIN